MAVKITCPTCGYSTTSRTQPLAEYGQRRHSCTVHLERAAHRNKAARARQQRPVRDCQHKQARHQHGTRAAYVLDQCRCDPCTKAATRAEKVRILKNQPAYIDAAPAIAHVRRLQAAGIGYKRVAQLAGISNATMTRLLYGRPDRRDHQPGDVARPATVNAILAVPLPTLEQLGSRVPVDSTGTRRRLQALATRGWSLTQVAHHAGLTDRQPLDKAMHDTVTGAATARAVRDAYDELWDQDPPAGGSRGAASAVARVRNHATRQGWAPPLAWDDESIDNPDAQPDLGQRTKATGRPGVDLDEFLWLINTGETPDRAAGRLGVRLQSIEATARRHSRDDVLAITNPTREVAA